jgi:hypothetical protein
MSIDLKALTSLVMGIAIVVIQALMGVYAGGISGWEWLGVAAIVFGPAGLVAAVNNTAYSPATKALVQHVSAIIIVLVQGIQGVYAKGITTEEWLGLGLILLTTLAVYVAPPSTAKVV